MVVTLRGEIEVANSRTDWLLIQEELEKRRETLAVDSSTLQDEGFPNPRDLASTDIFVEKAQQHLTERAERYFHMAIVMLVGAILAIIATIAWMTYFDIPRFMDAIGEAGQYEVTNQILIMYLVRATTLGVVFGAAIFVLGSLCFAFFHEATILFHRRHSLRFGRLYIYLKYGSEKRPELSRKDLEATFGWNLEMTTAFKRLRMDRNMIARATRTLEKLVERTSRRRNAAASPE